MDLKDVSDDFIMGLDIDKKQFQLLAMACTEMGWKLASVGSGWVELEIKSSKGNKNDKDFNVHKVFLFQGSKVMINMYKQTISAISNIQEEAKKNINYVSLTWEILMEFINNISSENYFHFNRYEFIKSQYVLGDY